MAARLNPRDLRVYVVTSAAVVSGRGHLEVAAAAIEGGATAIQLRAPELDGADLSATAGALLAACRRAGVLFIVNDRVDVAAATGADGVHLGQDDSPDDARAAIGPDRILGVSVRDAAQAHAAEAAGADYLGVTVWATPTKPEAVAEGLGGVGTVVRATRLPVVGIGGIHPGNAGDVIRAGAAGVAVISAVAASADPIAATRELRDVVDRTFDRQRGTS